MRTDKLTQAALATVASVMALAPLAGCSASDPAPTPSAPTPSASRPAPTAEAPSATSAPASEYEDGTYNAVGEYGGGPSYLDVTLTVSDNVVTAVTVEPQAENETSLGYQERFAAAVPEEVVGKSLDEADVGKLAGASTCPDGFNDAMAQIRDQARSDN